jgi:hypothetical protein
MTAPIQPERSTGDALGRGSTEQLLGVGPLDEAIGANSMIAPFNCRHPVSPTAA